MFRCKYCPLIVFMTMFFPLIAVQSWAISDRNDVYKLPNGMTVILKESHGSPMVASMIFVRSGSKYESQFENGITHFLEHLLFDGTAHKSRVELDNAISNLGGYINAFTRKEMTAYLVLLPSQYIEYGLTQQADMLFNSVFPEDELAKERKVVIEEINRNSDSPGAAAEKFFTERAYFKTPYDRPVLGYKAFIENIPRTAVVDYWRRFYVPQNMTLMVIGDFATATMKEQVEMVFGKISGTYLTLDKADTTSEKGTNSLSIGDPMSGQQVYDTIASVDATYINFSVSAPRFDSDDYLPFDLLSRFLGMEDISPLMTALKNGPEPLATEVSVTLNPYEECSRLEISIVSDKPDSAQAIAATVVEHLKSMPTHTADNEVVEGLKTSVRTETFYNAEKLHYLGFMVGPMLMTAGWDFVEAYPDNIAKISWGQCRTAAKRWLSEPTYIVTIVRPADSTHPAPYRPYEMTTDEVISHFASARMNEHALDTSAALSYPATSGGSFDFKDNAVYHREVLDNGLTVIIKSQPESRVFAMNVIGKNRSASETDDKAGITDFVNRCIEKGTVTRSASELARDLAKIGANVTLYDNPWIPYDDRYTVRQYSFMKFETIDEFAQKGFHLFCDMLLSPAFEPTEVENVKKGMLGVLKRQSSTPSNVARDLFYKALFDTGAYARPIGGTETTLNAITVSDLKAHHRGFYSPGNIVLSIVTNKEIDTVREWISGQFGRLGKEAYQQYQPSSPISSITVEKSHQDLPSEQIAIYLGSPAPAAGDIESVALETAVSILSERLYQNLREKQGLAYSVGAGAQFDRQFGWYYSSIATAPENYDKAVEGILLQVDKLRLDGPTAEEVSRAKNQLWGRLMSAKLSSINQAFYLGVDEYLNRPVGYDALLLKALESVDTEKVQRAAARYLRTDAYTIASAGKQP